MTASVGDPGRHVGVSLPRPLLLLLLLPLLLLPRGNPVTYVPRSPPPNIRMDVGCILSEQPDQSGIDTYSSMYNRHALPGIHACGYVCGWGQDGGGQWVSRDLDVRPRDGPSGRKPAGMYLGISVCYR